jgi:hypothetical protein
LPSETFSEEEMMTSQAVSLLLAFALVQSNGSEWSRVQQLRAGSRIIVTAHRREAPDEQYVVATRQDSITLFEPATLPVHVRRFVARVVSQHPDFVRTGGEFIEDGVSLTRDGVFAGGSRLAEVPDFMPTIPRADIIEVIEPARGPSATIVTAAVAGGIAVGLVTMTKALFAPCYGSCGSNLVMAVASAGGIPVAAGFLAAQATRRKAEVIYQGSSVAGDERHAP